jgi:3-hydroxyacyl-[acyl-carrier-protein] dehydratase
MTLDCPPDVVALFRRAARQPLLSPAEWPRGPRLERREVEALIPHRDPFLFIDGVSGVDHSTSTIVCHHDLHRAASVFEGHFPGRPMWPGVLQVEAIGQAGLCLVRLSGMTNEEAREPGFVLTHILGAEFVHPVTPAGQLEVVARVLLDGLFTIFVGQCLQHGVVSCAAAVRGINKEIEHAS